jgi:hypothetical protein
MAPVEKPGEYYLIAKLSSEAGQSPVACSTDLLQPVKGRSCRLIKLDVKAQ